MNVILFDNNRTNYYPLSFTRPIAYFRIGILTIKEKWEQKDINLISNFMIIIDEIICVKL